MIVLQKSVEIIVKREAIFLLLACYLTLIHMPPVFKKLQHNGCRYFILMHSLLL